MPWEGSRVQIPPGEVLKLKSAPGTAWIISVDGEVRGEYDENGNRAQHLLVMKGNAQSFARAMEVHNPPSSSATAATEAGQSEEAGEADAVIQEVMQSGFDYQKLVEIKDVLVRQGRNITVDAMWDVLEKDAEHHGRTLPVRKDKENTSVSGTASAGVDIHVGASSSRGVHFDEGVELMQTSSTEAQADEGPGDLALSPSDPVNEEELIGQDIVKIEQVCQVVGVDRQTAIGYLKVAHGNVETAIGLHFGM
eukprot:SAG31_NODE_6312_length_2070_cov_1.396246_2_plen_251_part_00